MTVTPMMRQYQDAKRAAPDALLLFRMGDFYELFFEDAAIAARTLGLALTSRDKGAGGVPMAGFPYHQLEAYLGKLIKSGHRVAICEQVEDPKKAQGLVRREVTRIVTPGTLTDDALLDPRQNNYLAAVIVPTEGRAARAGAGPAAGVAWIELSTGRFQAATVAAERLVDELARIGPAECLVVDGAAETAKFAGRFAITARPGWAFAPAGAQEVLTKHFGTSTLEGFGFGDDDLPAIRAAGAVLEYLAETQKSSLQHIERLVRYQAGTTLELDESTRRSLEITRTLRDGQREGSLWGVLDRSVTAMGSRRLAEWIAAPLVDRAAIDARLDAVAEFVAQPPLLASVAEQLRGAYDLERLLARVATGRASPRDLAFIRRTLGLLPQLKAKLTARTSELLTQLEQRIDLCPALRSQLDAALEEECPLSSLDGGFIRSGFSTELDGLRDLAAGGKQWIARYQAEQIEKSGIASLKVGYNKVFGYYLEVTNTHRDKVPDHFIRKQTIKNSERYITPELKEYEEKVVSADERAKELERELLLTLRGAVDQHARTLQATAAVLGELDALASLATLARERGYCRPTIVDEPLLRIVDGRHPVLDVLEPQGSFVPNDTAAGGELPSLLVITGPNMAGKSTYIRQVALITLLAQIGSFVPAREATIGVADRLFARVGASDELSRGHSTFMVEMTETARILHGATKRSLVILDEIGRGTSTYDGLALAWAVVEHLHDQVQCRTLFATHYHELTDLERSLPGLKNLNVAVREWQEEVVFLHKIVDGAADKSYGIHVARLAGVPRSVNERAKQILARLEDEHLEGNGWAKGARTAKRQGDLQLTLFGYGPHPVLEELRAVDLERMTPLDAINELRRWQQRLAEESDGS